MMWVRVGGHLRAGEKDDRFTSILLTIRGRPEVDSC